MKSVKEFITRRGKGWVCEINNEIIGFSILDLKENNIWALFAKPEFEKLGISIKLHNIMLDWFFKQTSTSVWLGASPQIRAEMFYKNIGWDVVGIHFNGEMELELSYTDLAIEA